ncbi:MAG: 2-C-methyl-D-erythritol 4-phosphate cytidylyltransferase [Verrucomicrobiales bacterium]
MRAAIIVASGSSRRMGFDKLAAEFAGERVLVRTVRAFLAVEEIGQVVVVTPEERFSWLAGLDGRLERVDGGAERADSVARGLAALGAEVELVAVHDGARPLVREEEIGACFSAAGEFGAAALARRVTETLKRADAQGLTLEGVDREGLWAMETPQVFRADLLRQAYEEVRARGVVVTDEVSALELIGVRTKLVENFAPNLKITVRGDLRMAERLLEG